MPINKDPITGEIIETPTPNDDQFQRTGVVRSDGFAICDKIDRVKQLQFDTSPQQSNTKTTLKSGATSGDVVITLPAASGTLATGSSGGVGFGIIQPDTGTSPTATVVSDTLTITNPDSRVPVAGNSTQKKITIDTTSLASNTDFTGDSGAGGVHGLVPAPSAGDAAAGKYLKANGSWATPPVGTGDVVGPASAVNLNVAAFDGTTGKLLKDSGKPLSDIGAVSFPLTVPTSSHFYNDPQIKNTNVGNGLAGLSFKAWQNACDALWITVNGNWLWAFDDGVAWLNGRIASSYNGSSSLPNFYSQNADCGFYVTSGRDVGLTSNGVDKIRALATNGNVQIFPDLELPTVGTGLKVKEGTNAKMGTATLSGGTATVSTTKVTANSRIFLTIQDPNGGTVGTVYVSARTASTSFVITSTSGSDTSIVAWMIVEPA